MSTTASRGRGRGRFSTGGRAPPLPLVDRVPRGPNYSLISVQHVQRFFTNDKSLDRLGRFLNEHILDKDVDLESCRVVLQAVKNVRYHDKGPPALLIKDNELDDKVMTEDPDLWGPFFGVARNGKVPWQKVLILDNNKGTVMGIRDMDLRALVVVLSSADMRTIDNDVEGRTPCYGCDSNDKILGGCKVPNLGAGLGLDENYYGNLTTCLNCWIRGIECEYMPAGGEDGDGNDEDEDEDDEDEDDEDD